MPGPALPADLAFAHLDGMLAPFRAGSPELLLALPAGYSREQLGLLLGVAAEGGTPVCGIVDSAVAAVAPEPVGARVLHLDLELHYAVLTALDRDSELRRSHSELLPRHGLLALQEAWIEMIAATFVRRTRFDPLHQAANEQELWNRLPGWLAELERSERIDVELLRRAGLAYGGADARVDAGRDRALLSGPAQVRAEDVPGGGQHRAPAVGSCGRRAGSCGAALEPSRCQCEITGTGSGGARFAQVCRGDPQTGRAGRAGYSPDGNRVGRTGERRSSASHTCRRRSSRRTCVYEGRALAISAVPLAVGWSVPSGERTLHVPAGPGVSRNHCSFVRRDGNALLEDHSTYGTYRQRRARCAASLHCGSVTA